MFYHIFVIKKCCFHLLWRMIAVARDLEEDIELTPKCNGSYIRVTRCMNVVLDAKHVKLQFSLTKHLPIVDPSLIHELLVQVKRHYNICCVEP